MAVYYDQVVVDLRRGPDTTLAKPVRTQTSESVAATPGSKGTLEQNIPNPFDRTTTIPFVLLEQSRVRLFVTDIQGRTVAELLSGDRGAGRYEIIFDPSGLAGGTYLYSLEVNGVIQTRSMTITPK